MSRFTYTIDNWPLLLAGATFAYIGLLVVRFVRHRRFYKDLPSPEHSFILGNLKVMGEKMKNYPADMHPQPLFVDLQIEHNYRGLYYMDMYPFSYSLAIITDPGVASQVQTSPDFYRHPMVNGFLGGLVGTKSIFVTKGNEWQRQRSWFSPAFSLSHLLTLIPGMVEEALVFKEKLTKFAVSGEVFSMNDAALKLTIDVIARSVGDIRLKSQTEYSEIQDRFIKATDWTAGMTDPVWKKLMSPFMMKWHTKKLDALLGKVIKDKYDRTSEDGVDKSILDLALKGYLKDNGRLDILKSGRADLNKDFMQIALDNAKVFLIGGHDTTSSMITYMYYCLSTHPKFLTRIRDEHDQVFGSTFEATIQSLSLDSHLLNKIPLTLAVLKEVERLYPPGFTVRAGVPGSTVTFEGRKYPMEGHMICNLMSAIHRDPNHWTNPNEFEPDRWLESDPDPSKAWQPFEKGPRNCIGQQLAILEAKVIAVLTLRYFDFEAMFKPHGLSIPRFGGRAYQELKLTAKPKDGIPMKAKLTGRT